MGPVLVAFAIGGVILIGTVWVVRLIAKGPPPEPDPEDIEEVEAHYLCTVCGMRLTVTHAQGGDPAPPKHCREEMILTA